GPQIVGLVSGGKDSLFSLQIASELGFKVVGVCNLWAADELDSFMYQSVCTTVVQQIARAMDVKLIRKRITGKPLQQDFTTSSNRPSTPTPEHDETEDLYLLLREAKNVFPELHGVCVGAIFSDYQRLRVESVCSRLGLVCYAYLWRVPQPLVLRAMKEDPQFDAILVKVCSMGLDQRHLGRTLRDLEPTFFEYQKKFHFHVCGEGGEYETLCLRSKLYVHNKEREKAYWQNKRGLLGTSGAATTSAATSCSTTLRVRNTGPGGEDSPKPRIRLLRRHTRTSSLLSTRASSHGAIQSESHLEQIMKRSPSCTSSATTGTNKSSTTSSVAPPKHRRGSFENAAMQAELVFNFARELLLNHGLEESVLFVDLQLADVAADFGEVNKLYSSVLFPNKIRPPSRCCYQTSLPPGVKLRLDRKKKIDVATEVATTHVQSVSGWAMACIGPYAQAVRRHHDGLFLSAGVLGLIPHAMILPSAGGRKE
ncbi:unnamed protein product, partial [Amoebophrya sp. A25]